MFLTDLCQVLDRRDTQNGTKLTPCAVKHSAFQYNSLLYVPNKLFRQVRRIGATGSLKDTEVILLVGLAKAGEDGLLDSNI